MIAVTFESTVGVSLLATYNKNRKYQTGSMQQCRNFMAAVIPHNPKLGLDILHYISIIKQNRVGLFNTQDQKDAQTDAFTELNKTIDDAKSLLRVLQKEEYKDIMTSFISIMHNHSFIKKGAGDCVEHFIASYKDFYTNEEISRYYLFQNTTKNQAYYASLNTSEQETTQRNDNQKTLQIITNYKKANQLNTYLAMALDAPNAIPENSSDTEAWCTLMGNQIKEKASKIDTQAEVNEVTAEKKAVYLDENSKVVAMAARVGFIESTNIANGQLMINRIGGGQQIVNDSGEANTFNISELNSKVIIAGSHYASNKSKDILQKQILYNAIMSPADNDNNPVSYLINRANNIKVVVISTLNPIIDIKQEQKEANKPAYRDPAVQWPVGTLWQQMLEANLFERHRFTMHDHLYFGKENEEQNNLLRDIKQIVLHMEAIIKNGNAALFQCAEGMSRSVAFWAAFMMLCGKKLDGEHGLGTTHGPKPNPVILLLVLNQLLDSGHYIAPDIIDHAVEYAEKAAEKM